MSARFTGPAEILVDPSPGALFTKRIDTRTLAATIATYPERGAR